MSLHSLYVVPLLSAFFATAALLVPCITEWLYNGVFRLRPFYRDTNQRSEICIIAQLVNTSALFLGMTAYLRHREIVEYYGHRLGRPAVFWRSASLVLLWIALATAFGFSVAVNFQGDEVRKVRDSGAAVAVVFCLAYCWGQVLFAYSLRPRMAAEVVNHARALLCILETVFLALRLPMRLLRDFSNENAFSPSEFLPTHPSISEEKVDFESAMAFLMFQLFVATFAIELRYAYAHAPRMQLQTRPPSYSSFENYQYLPIEQHYIT